MMKKICLLLSLLFVMPQGIFAADAPILTSTDTDTISDNLKAIGSNLYDIGRNTARIGVKSTVTFTNAGVKFTKFMSDHPVFAVLTMGSGIYCWYKWRKENQRRRNEHLPNMTLRDLWVTMSAHFVGTGC